MILPLVFRLKPWQAVPRSALLFGYRLDIGERSLQNRHLANIFLALVSVPLGR